MIENIDPRMDRILRWANAIAGQLQGFEDEADRQAARFAALRMIDRGLRDQPWLSSGNNVRSGPLADNP